MKRISLLILCLFSSSFAISSDLLEKWQQFKFHHGKDYQNDIEAEFRLKIFTDNLLKVTRHNQQYEEGKQTYMMSLNRFSDMMHSEFTNTMTTKISPSLRKGTPLNKGELNKLMTAEVPERIDWREKGAIGPVADQKLCGCCWAFSALGAQEAAHFLKTGKMVDLSEQNLVDCTADYNCHGCSGGYPDKAYEYIFENGGINAEHDYPYEEMDKLPCRFDSKKVASQITGHVVLPANDEKTLEKAVGTIGPVSILFNAGMPGFNLYSGGIYSVEGCDAELLNHAMMIVGYGSEDGQEYWLIKNSFSTEWGDKGYMKVAKNKGNMCGVAASSVYPTL